MPFPRNPGCLSASTPPAARPQGFWRLTLAVALLLVAPLRAAEPWRELPEFQQASREIEQLLTASGDADSTSLTTQWRQAIDSAPSASRLGEPLRRLASVADQRYAVALEELGGSPPGWLTADEAGHASLRLAAAELLSLQRRHDDCIRWLNGVDPSATFSPLLCEFLRLVAYRQTVADEQARQCVARIQTLAEPSPPDSLGRARAWVLDAIRAELREQPKPIPNIARRMHDVERRLAQLGAGEATQEQQRTILDELDKLIKDLEEQQRQQQQQQAAAQQGGPGGSIDPAEESRPSDLKGPGEVDRKRLVSGDAWGALPPAERERLTQEITKDFPPHYRSLVEDYFRTLAAPPDEAPRESRP
ncbi:hypothetical protein [Botrimarina sp.]|uniref:hypothetical protein n=1 Tax=Botrimarina sp. TaxID=2795802 RepID=UPI0032EB3CF1